MVSMMKGSNVEIKSDGARHSVFVEGVKMDFVTKVVVDYTHGEIPTATIVVLMPEALTKAESKS